jgi:hypothetical protein
MRAARRRTARTGRAEEPAPEVHSDAASESAEGVDETPPAPDDEPNRPDEPPDTSSQATPPHPQSSLAWTSLVLLTVILGGFMLTLLLMLG